MAKGIEQLSALKVEKAKEPGYYFDGGGLYLQVSKAGTKSWIFRFRLGQRIREMGLGSFQTYGLADARALAAECRKLVHAGKDPIEARKAERNANLLANATAMTFKDCASAYIDMKAHEWSNAKHAEQWTATLEAYAYPTLGAVPVDQIQQQMVLKCLRAIWADKTETATRVRQRIEAVLDWATASKFRTGDNPARWKGHLDKLLPKPAKLKKVEHHPALPYTDAYTFMRQLRAMDGTAARALEFCILTAARTGEAIGATWDEIDLAGAVWTVPAERMKMKREHRVALSAEALALLKALPRVEGNPHLFPGLRAGKALSNMAMLNLLERMGHSAITVHGFRSTFRDWAAEQTNFPSEVVEMALAHAIGNAVEAAYRRGDLLDKRALLMQAWATWCSTERKPATVTSLDEARKTNTAA